MMIDVGLSHHLPAVLQNDFRHSIWIYMALSFQTLQDITLMDNNGVSILLAWARQS